MEVSSRHIVALGAPLVVTYLTWSAVSGGAKQLAEITKAAPISTTAASKRPHIDALVRNPFAPAEAGDDPLSALASAGDGKDSPQGAALRLDGTAVAGRFRMAIINGERVFEGHAYRRLRLEKVTTDGVTMTTPGGETLRLSLDIAPAPVLPLSRGEARAGEGRTVSGERPAAPVGAAAAKGSTVSAGESKPPTVAAGESKAPANGEPKSTRMVHQDAKHFEANSATRTGPPR